MEQFSGGCLCGAVRFVAVGRPYRVGICHCLDCRKNHGALFHASAIFPKSAVTVTGQTGEYQGRYFCPKCGSPVFAQFGDEVGVNRNRPIGTALRFSPECRVTHLMSLWTAVATSGRS
jgi:hypothetical protein